MTDNELWANRIITRFDPSFEHRWVVYQKRLVALLNNVHVWLDVGCGNGEIVCDFAAMAPKAIGVDRLVSVHQNAGMFVCADLRSLPFGSDSVDIISMRFVAEHISDVPNDLSDVVRVLKKGGYLLVLTTNLWSPLISIPRVMPFKLKRWLLRALFKVNEEDVFPTYHRFNSKSAMSRALQGMHLVEMQYLQDTNFTRKTIFMLYFALHLLTRPLPLQRFRTNILALLQKE